MLIVVEAMLVQLRPSAERYAVIRVPCRTSRTHAGASPDPLAATRVVVPPVEVRACKATPTPGEIAANAFRALAVSPSRIMTPALLHSLAVSKLATRALMSTSPEIARYAKWNSSAVSQTL